MSLTNFQLNKILDILEEKAIEASEKAEAHMQDDQHIYLASREEGREDGFRHARSILLAAMHEDENERNRELDALTRLHGLDRGQNARLPSIDDLRMMDANQFIPPPAYMTIDMESFRFPVDRCNIHGTIRRRGVCRECMGLV